MKRLFTFVLLLLSISGAGSVHAEESINCSAKHSLFHGSTSVVALYHFILNKNHGAVLINGKLNNDGVETIISRSIYFNYENISADNYIVKNYNITKIPVDNTSDDIMEKHFPQFFTKTNTQLYLSIKKMSSGSYLISFFRTPLFYCMKY